MLKMFFTSEYISLKILAQRSYSDFVERVMDCEDVPPRIRSLILECVDPISSNRPHFDEIVRELEKALETEKLNAAKLAKNSSTQLDADLICRLFPPSIAEALRQGRKPEPEFIENCSILFSDVVGTYLYLSSERIAVSVTPDVKQCLIQYMYARYVPPNPSATPGFTDISSKLDASDVESRLLLPQTSIQ